MVEQFKHRVNHRDLCRWLEIPRSSHYYRPSNKKRGRRPTECTKKKDGTLVLNQQVVAELIEKVYSQGKPSATSILPDQFFRGNLRPGSKV